MLNWCDASYVTFSRVGVGWHRRYNDAVWAEWCIRICNTAARTRRGTRQRRSHVWEVTGETRMVWLVQHDTLTCVSSKSPWKHRGWGRGTPSVCPVQHHILCSSIVIIASKVSGYEDGLDWGSKTRCHICANTLWQLKSSPWKPTCRGQALTGSGFSGSGRVG